MIKKEIEGKELKQVLHFRFSFEPRFSEVDKSLFLAPPLRATSCNVHYSGPILYDNERETWSKSTKGLDSKHRNSPYIFQVVRARNNVPNVPDHGDRQSRLFADQIKIWPIRSICPHFLNMPLNTHLNRKFNFISNSSLNN